MLRVDTNRRPEAGWHQGETGTVFHVSHVGGATHIECFERGDNTTETQARLAALLQKRAFAALPAPPSISPLSGAQSSPMQQI